VCIGTCVVYSRCSDWSSVQWSGQLPGVSVAGRCNQLWYNRSRCGERQQYGRRSTGGHFLRQRHSTSGAVVFDSAASLDFRTSVVEVHKPSAVRVGHGLDPSTDWIGSGFSGNFLDRIGLGGMTVTPFFKTSNHCIKVDAVSFKL